MKSSEVSIKTRSPPASLSFKGQATKQETVKLSTVVIMCPIDTCSSCCCLHRHSIFSNIKLLPKLTWEGFDKPHDNDKPHEYKRKC